MRLGDVYAVKEPYLKDVITLGSNTPILKFPGSLVKLVKNPFQVVEPTTPEIDQSRFFHLEHQSIMLSTATVVRTQCTGITCDRQRKDLATCGCLYTPGAVAGFNHVLEVDIFIRGYPSLTVSPWTSYYFTTLLFDLPLPSDADYKNYEQGRSAYRACFKELVYHVNQHGGWTILGWQRRGTIIDKMIPTGGQNSVPDLVAECATVHLTRVSPTTLTRDYLRDNKLQFPIGGLFPPTD